MPNQVYALLHWANWIVPVTDWVVNNTDFFFSVDEDQPKVFK